MGIRGCTEVRNTKFLQRWFLLTLALQSDSNLLPVFVFQTRPTLEDPFRCLCGGAVYVSSSRTGRLTDLSPFPTCVFQPATMLPLSVNLLFQMLPKS